MKKRSDFHSSRRRIIVRVVHTCFRPFVVRGLTSYSNTILIFLEAILHLLQRIRIIDAIRKIKHKSYFYRYQSGVNW